MRFDRLTDWSILLTALLMFSLLGGLGLGLSILVLVAYPFGLVAGALYLLEGRRLEGPARPAMRMSGIILLLGVASATIITLLATPLSFKGNPGTGVNQAPADIVVALQQALLPVILAVSSAVGAWAWRARLPAPYRELTTYGGLGGAVLLLITSFVQLPGGSTTQLVVQALFSVAYGAATFGLVQPWVSETIDEVQ